MGVLTGRGNDCCICYIENSYRKKVGYDPFTQIERIIGLLKVLQGVSIQEGKIESPFGTPLVGVKITIDDGLPHVKLDYVRESVNEILNKLPQGYKVVRH